VAIIWNILGVLALLTTESDLKVDSIALVFEQVSAFGTVGLSTGLTSKLSTPGKLWIILTMFIGRLGPLTLVMLMIPKSTSNVRYPKGTVMIG
jgi:trk system potassium uptake protein TrkH